MGERRENCDDMISGLPEDLLITILLYLPIKDAVATMILSKRWLFIWTKMPVLEYYEEEEEDNDDERKKSVWWLLDKSMQLHNAPVLIVLYMTLGPRCPEKADVGKWIAKAVDRGVISLRLDLLLSSLHPTSLPNTLYLSQSLKSLSLSHNILVDVPSSTTSLPSLTRLRLKCVVYKNDDSLINLLATCPILESFSVIRKDDDNVKKFTVRSPSLLDFCYTNEFVNYDLVVEDTSRCLVIDTPTLTELHLFDISGETCFLIQNPSCCFEYVSICTLFGWSVPNTNNFLRSFSKVVLSLELNLSEEMALCFRTIKFPRLIDFKIFPDYEDWMDTFVSLLQNTPRLKSLTVNYEFTDDRPWAAPIESSYDPECLSSSLEKFKLVSYEGKEEEDLVEYILTNAKCLKTATISMKSTLTLIHKRILMEEVESIPMVSKTSKLLFHD